MAVTMTTKFYKGNVPWELGEYYSEDNVVTWSGTGGSGAVLSYQCSTAHTSAEITEPGKGGSWTSFWDTGTTPSDLSKIVFTSPNMNSPNTAGTRSHILPGLEDLGLWYEDTTNIYRVEAAQEESTETFFGYSGMLHDSFDLSSPSLSITISGTNQVDWIEFVRERVNITPASGTSSFPVQYTPLDVFAGAGNVFLASSGTPTEAKDAFGATGWEVDELGVTDHWVQVEFTTSKRITKFVMDSPTDYEAKHFKVQAKYNIGDSYVDLYSDQLEYNNQTQEFVFSNLNPYKYYRLYFIDKWAASGGMGVVNGEFYEFEIDENVTNPIPIYFSDDQIVNINTANPGVVDDYQLKLEVDTVVDGSVVLPEGTPLYCWGFPNGYADVNMMNSINIEVTNGECYNCRLTAWDDVTHTTTTNELIAGDHCRVSSLAYNCKGNVVTTTENDEVSFVHPPLMNNIFKGNVVYNGTPYYYGDFNLKYRTAGLVSGDFLIFKPMLYNVNPSISYGVHDFYIVLHYSYT